MEGIEIKIVCWEDGCRVEKELDKTDRWTLHTAVELQVTLPWANNVMIRLKQEPHALNASRMGVGACLWEGELFLAAYLATLPVHRFIGARVIELGSGPGLIGLMLAKLGAKVIITDIQKVLSLAEHNVKLNGLLVEQRRGAVSGYAEVQELEWGKEGYEQVVSSLASAPVDWVLAADCCYIDNEGESPSTEHFIRTCHGLCGESTRCLVSFELRSNQVKSVFLKEAARAFSRVERIPSKSLPKGCQIDHIELYDLQGKRDLMDRT
ncbi:hypothetical protein CEUSTIGMA_g1322.t1 [Chlamydomonas eustigma]|uniref:Uncharacterized protein n=1 Tax=Chlamydomonas eustigma TaxID=1157962 RepID=A0A250WT85_9CHLO|nr:hypothetical protein CEUSTIGMA_g1322.t1 [Chlamydomonas eustigma]|eukprot:GAX73872.1 hypothetical protein CEUSTIGMA_g1322.t1 [Chlamydomonas eustigma]